MSSETGGFLVFLGVCLFVAWPAVVCFVRVLRGRCEKFK